MNREDVLAATDAAYAAALGEAGWDRLGHALQRLCASRTATLWTGNPAMSAESLFNVEVPEAEVQAYFSQQGAFDPWLNAWAGMPRQRPPRIVNRGTDFLSDRDLRRTAFYADLGRRTGMFHATGAIAVLGATDVMVLGLHRPEHHDPCEDAHIRALERVVPHIRRALLVRRRLRHSIGTASPDAQDALEAIAVPAMVVRGDARVVVCNEAMRAAEARGFGPRCIRTGHGEVTLGTRLGADQPALLHMVAAVAAGEKAGGAVVLTPAAGRPTVAMVLPMPPRFAAACPPHPRGHALLIARQPGVGGLPRLTALRDLFGLTVAEAGVLDALAGGIAVDTVAAERGVSVATIRTQIRAILDKTQCSNLRALEHLLGSLTL